ncbi:TetR/AcrR family transcriptional regulator [Cellulomonas sp. McL0617]|uniref:TetR/AcrR family transcriptional regulator n=1 Tax=Cellulomonas sp. McL0617 TaxID=3415675 RepID=UPI003CEBE8EF
MPAPDRTNLPAIVVAARAILERKGAAGLTMQAVAEQVGVRAPSLYKRVEGRDELVGLVVEATLRELGERLGEVQDATAGQPEAQALPALARAFREFAHTYPAGHAMAFGPLPPASRPAHDVLVASVAPVLRATTALVGDAHALDAARTVTAWANGFLAMELSGAFQLGGDVTSAFDYGVTLLVDALGRRHPTEEPES